MGVRMSCDILERNWDLAALAALAVSAISLSSSVVAWMKFARRTCRGMTFRLATGNCSTSFSFADKATPSLIPTATNALLSSPPCP